MSAVADEFDALLALAERQRSAGRLAEAADVFRQILVLRPNLPEAHNDLGSLLVRLGRFEEARRSFEGALALRPQFAEAHNNLGVLFFNWNQLDQAVAHFQQALALKPDHTETHNNIGLILAKQGKLDEAIASFRRALALRPNFAEVHSNLGNTLRDLGRLDEAVASYRQALLFKPNFVDAINNLGNTLKYQGAFDEAIERFEQALALKPDFAEAHFNRAELRKFQPADPQLVALERLADAGQLPPGKMLYIHFALAKAYEDLGDFSRAFQHMAQGNALKRREAVYDESTWARGFDEIVAAFDRQLFERFAGAGDPSPRPIFILGMLRSGSTLIEQILASHPLVQAAGELKNLSNVANGEKAADGHASHYPACIAQLGADDYARLGRSYLASLPPLTTGKQRITDKMPANFLYVGLIRLMLPGARIIHTVRDPVDTCLSCFARLFSAGQEFSYDLAELGRYYRRYHELMHHWGTVLPADSMLEIAYEDVVDDLEGQARRLVAYCGLPWDDRCLEFHNTRRPIKTASTLQVRQPLYRSSLGRWRRYESFLGPLLDALQPCRQSPEAFRARVQ